ncbi:hypothetical protein [Nocardioides convexus]|uniref:hypothetical protein n=1 Tax=Nocardioides convexus TaxID=2712224 RepID=UPI0024188F70|nr:hypothetical protein [Nocardioides convexus]
MKPTRTVLAGATVVLALALAACGESSDTLSADDKKVGAGTSVAPVEPAHRGRRVRRGRRPGPARKASRRRCSRAGRLSIGVTEAVGETFLPHSGSTADGTQVGLDIDLRNAVAKVLGVSLGRAVRQTSRRSCRAPRAASTTSGRPTSR